MFVQRIVRLWIISASLLAVAACGTPGTESNTATEVLLSATQVPQDQVQNSPDTPPVDATAPSIDGSPTSVAEQAQQTPNQTAPGASIGDGGVQSQPQASNEQSLSGETVVYNDTNYNFRVSRPADFVVRIQPADKLAEFTPTPASSFRFMNPKIASSDIVDLEPADLEIRVFETGPPTPLESWLTSNHLMSTGDKVQPFDTANISGVQVCASTALAPGCSYFILDNARVYQLTPATQEGEAMIETFMLLR